MRERLHTLLRWLLSLKHKWMNCVKMKKKEAKLMASITRNVKEEDREKWFKEKGSPPKILLSRNSLDHGVSEKMKRHSMWSISSLSVSPKSCLILSETAGVRAGRRTRRVKVRRERYQMNFKLNSFFLRKISLLSLCFLIFSSWLFIIACGKLNYMTSFPVLFLWEMMWYTIIFSFASLFFV